MSLDLFAGKLLRGRVVSAEEGVLRIELGGAILEAKSSRVFAKGEVVTLRVKGITSNGVSLEIVDVKSTKAESVIRKQMMNVERDSKEILSLRESIFKLLQTKSGVERISIERNVAGTMKDVLRAGEKYDFFYMAFPIKLADDKPRYIELLMRQIKEKENSDELRKEEYFFRISTARLGEIMGKLLRLGKQLRLDLTGSNAKAVDELRGIKDGITASITNMGFNLSSFNIRHGEIKNPIENAIEE